LIKTAIPRKYNIDNSSYELHQSTSTSSTPSQTDPLLGNTLDTDDEIDLNVLKPTHTYLNRSPETPTFYFSQKNSNNTLEEEINLRTPKNAHNKTSAMPNLSPSSRLFIQEIINMPTPKKCQNSQLTSFSSNDNSDNIVVETPTKRKMRNVIEIKKKKLNCKSSMVCKLQTKLFNVRNKLKIANKFKNKINYKSTNSRVLSEMQMFRANKSRQPWSVEEKQFAISLFYNSPGTYRFLRNVQKINLPGLSTIKGWIGSSKFSPGFVNSYMEQIKIKVNAMDNEQKYCVIAFDEMSIKKYLEYSKYLDVVEGYEDLGHKGRNDKVASQALVFIARGLYSKWKLPLAYFLSASSTRCLELKNLISDVIEKALEVGLIITAVICDQGSNNCAALKQLGCTKESPYFEVNGKRIFSILDIPHIFKNYRNNFLKNNLVFDGNEISFSDIRTAYEIDKMSGTSRALLKITDSHINPGPFQKMKCKLALQLFSNTVTAVIKTCVTTGQIKSTTGAYTANFLKHMNDLFDCLNSKCLYSSNPKMCALSEERPSQIQFLNEAKRLHENIKLVKPNTKYGYRLPCFDGLVWSINSITMLYSQQKNLQFTYLLTSRLNQDYVENTFALFRQRGGYNPNPTARTFRSTFSIQAKNNLFKASELSNCESDMDSNLLAPTSNSDTLLNLVNESDSDYTSTLNVDDEPFTNTDDNLEEEDCEISLEMCSNAYFAGYLGKSCFDHFKCSKCVDKFLKKDENLNLFDQHEFLIFYKNYESKEIDSNSCFLKKPTEILIQFVKNAQIMLKKLVEQKPHRKNIAHFINKQITNKYLLSFNLDKSCTEHFDYLLTKLIHAKLLKDFNWKSRHLKQMKETSINSSRKLKILKNL